MNDAAKNTRRVLVESTWPSAVQVVNTAFIGRALRTTFSTKKDLRVEIYDDLGRANLAKHAYGGVKIPKGAHLAIPPKGKFQRGTHGIAKAQRRPPS